MSVAGWGAAACSAAFGGFVALSLAMDRHHEDTYGRGTQPAPGTRRWLRAGGTLGLLASLFASLAAAGRVQGWVFWLGALTAGALAVVLLQAYAPRQAPRAGWLSVALIIPCAAIGLFSA